MTAKARSRYPRHPRLFASYARPLGTPVGRTDWSSHIQIAGNGVEHLWGWMKWTKQSDHDARTDIIRIWFYFIFGKFHAWI